MSSSMNEPLWHALNQGAVLITVNRRLARELSDQYDRYQQQCGQAVWETSAIYPLTSWLQKSLDQLGEGYRLLNAEQAGCVWEQVVRDDLEQNGCDLLQVSATVRQAVQAHRLLCDYRVTPYQSLSDEQQAFVRWQHGFQQRCRQQGWLDGAELLDYIVQAVSADKLQLPPSMVWLGFDELNPAQQLLRSSLQQQGCCVEWQVDDASTTIPSAPASTITTYAANDEIAELEAAARWARQRLELQVGTVAVVIPELARLQRMAERVFRSELRRSSCPEQVPVETFNISLGYPLAEQGIIAAALELLQLEDEIEFESLSYLLRCPWFNGGLSEAVERADCERWLRERNVRQISLTGLLKLLRRYPTPPKRFIDMIQRLCRWLKQDEVLPPSVWGERINSLLNELGWPAERAINSDEYQTLAAWQQKVVQGLAALGMVVPDVDRRGAVSRLRKIATELLFQPKAQDQRLQIIGLLETAGLHFDAVWLSGITDQVLPGTVVFNPFLPVAVQREYAMPHSSVEHEDLYARRTLKRLLAAASEVVVSYPRSQQGSDSRCSPFVEAQLEILPLPEKDTGAPEPLQSILLESIRDDMGIGLESAQLAEPIKGGTGLLKEQVQCPFRAYAHYRLRTRSLEVPQAGLTSRCRGELMHLVLQHFWAQTGSHQQLIAMSDEQIKERVEGSVNQVVAGYPFAEHEYFLLGLERQRLQQLIIEWLELEKGREPFSVETVEQRQQFQVGPLTLTTIPDRIDRLADGSHVVIDYKSGKVSVADFLGEHLLEPQLPIYALEGVDGEVSGITFAQVRHGECCFRGVSVEEGLLPGVPGVAKSRAAKRGVADWPQLLADWQQQLQRSAEDFVAGVAVVEPVAPKVCQFCDLKALCRIESAQPENSANNDGVVGDE
ncbi:MAG: PD-(D/E)XK nuclease family protein [Desulfuromonas sp.]|nr:PD-(D/E)XK nuclease family protein [Desulfuromonas sp.]